MQKPPPQFSCGGGFLLLYTCCVLAQSTSDDHAAGWSGIRAPAGRLESRTSTPFAGRAHSTHEPESVYVDFTQTRASSELPCTAFSSPCRSTRVTLLAAVHSLAGDRMPRSRRRCPAVAS
jgi:hypothetical protein